MTLNRFIFNLRIGVDALMNNRSRAVLTSLGIIFGVASVIAMLAIGSGAEKEILQQIKEVGANNIIINPKTEDQGNQQNNNTPGSGDNSSDDDNSSSSSNTSSNANTTVIKRNTSPGLDIEDAKNMLASIPSIGYISSEVEIGTQFMYNGRYKDGRLVGVNNNFFELSNIKTGEGQLFNEHQLLHAEKVCIIGKNIKTRLFATNDPIGQYIKCGGDWIQIIGVLEGKDINKKDAQKLSIRNVNDDIYIPISTMLLRYRNRSLITPSKVRAARYWNRGNYNQLDRMVINIKQSDMMQPSTEVINRLLLRRHNGIHDYEIIVPELLLKQEQKTKSLFNIVLAIIASISLIVGGIGIMNIMLASVLERTREIGLRLAIGATKKDIVTQFVSEAICISLTGGIIGVLLGVLLSFLIQKTTNIQTIISPLSIVISFSISIGVGLFFGILPAKRASNYDPVVALRHE